MEKKRMYVLVYRYDWEDRTDPHVLETEDIAYFQSAMVTAHELGEHCSIEFAGCYTVAA